MKYCSTRGQEKNLSFEDVLFSGYAKDGGLYMPESFPCLSITEMQQWSTYSYPKLVFAVARKFIDEEEIPSQALNDIINNSLKRFRITDVVQIEKLKGGLNIVELFHGTTLAFKDLALSVVGGLLDYYLCKSNKHITILIGTSGDTGSAAIEGVRGRKGIDIVVLLPNGRCTQIQELQMTTVIEDNVHVYKAGCIAQKMGLPVTFVATVNDNDIVSRTFDRGDFSLSGSVAQTLASAMDIQNPYNMERLMYIFSNGDVKRIKTIMDEFQKEGKVTIPEDILNTLKKIIVDSVTVGDATIIAIMEKVYKDNKYIVCPHTATAAYYHYQRKSEIPRGYIATASPAKFPEAVKRAGIAPVTDGVDHLKDLPTKFMWMKKGEDWYSILRTKIESITKSRS